MPDTEVASDVIDLTDIPLAEIERLDAARSATLRRIVSDRRRTPVAAFNSAI